MANRKLLIKIKSELLFQVNERVLRNNEDRKVFTKGKKTGRRLDFPFVWSPICTCSATRGWVWQWRTHWRCQTLIPFTGKPGWRLAGRALQVKSKSEGRGTSQCSQCPRTLVMPRVCAGAPGLSFHELSSSPQEDAEE